MNNELELDSHSNAEDNLLHILCITLLIVPILFYLTNIGRQGGMTEFKTEIICASITFILLSILLVYNLYIFFGKLSNTENPKFIEYNEKDNSITIIDYKKDYVIKLEDLVEINLRYFNGSTKGTFLIRKNNRSLWDKITDNLLIEIEVYFKIGEFDNVVEFFNGKNINLSIK